MRLRAPALALLLVLPLVLAACGDKTATAPDGVTTQPPLTDGVTTSAAPPAPPPPPPPVTVEPPPAGSKGAAAVAAYRAYLKKQANIFMKQTTIFTTALREGDPETAVKTYPKARAAYERLQRIAARLDLDTAMNAQEGAVPAESWSGYHMIEKTIFDSGMTSGTEQPAVELQTNAQTMRNAVDAIQLDPELILNDAQQLLARIVDTTTSPDEEKYSLQNIYAISGNLRSAEAAWKAIRPLAAEKDPKLAKEIDGAIATAVTTIESYRTSRGFSPYDELGENERAQIQSAVEVAREKLAGVDVSA